MFRQGPIYTLFLLIWYVFQQNLVTQNIFWSFQTVMIGSFSIVFQDPLGNYPISPPSRHFWRRFSVFPKWDMWSFPGGYLIFFWIIWNHLNSSSCELVKDLWTPPTFPSCCHHSQNQFFFSSRYIFILLKDSLAVNLGHSCCFSCHWDFERHASWQLAAEPQHANGTMVEAFGRFDGFKGTMVHHVHPLDQTSHAKRAPGWLGYIVD